MNTKELNKTYNLIIKIIIVIISIGFLIYQLFIRQDIKKLYDDIAIIMNADGILWLIFLTTAAMPLNWTLEAIKWKYLLKNTEKISLGTAMKAVYSGATISAVSPNRTGDYLARVFVLKKTNFWHGVLITLIGSYAQNIVTLLFGGIAFFGLFANKLIELDYVRYGTISIFQTIFFIALTLSILLYFRISLLAKIFPASWVKMHKYVDIFKQYKFNQLFVTLLISTLRYLFYSLQFYIIFLAVGFNDIDLLHGMALISSIFLLNTIRPSIALLEIGIRSSVAIFVFGLYYGFDTLNYQNAVFTASTLIWLINIILPAIIGLFFIKDLKFFKTRTNVR